jgi:hypothetical protein
MILIYLEISFFRVLRNLMNIFSLVSDYSQWIFIAAWIESLVRIRFVGATGRTFAGVKSLGDLFWKKYW